MFQNLTNLNPPKNTITQGAPSCPYQNDTCEQIRMLPLIFYKSIACYIAEELRAGFFERTGGDYTDTLLHVSYGIYSMAFQFLDR